MKNNKYILRICNISIYILIIILGILIIRLIFIYSKFNNNINNSELVYTFLLTGENLINHVFK